MPYLFSFYRSKKHILQTFYTLFILSHSKYNLPKITIEYTYKNTNSVLSNIFLYSLKRVLSRKEKM